MSRPPGLTLRTQPPINPPVLRKPTFRAILGALCLSALGACGDDRYIVIGTPEAPSTSGYVEVDDDDGGVAALVVLLHLHPPQRLGEELAHYVVWVSEGAGKPRRAGVLKYDPDDRTGRLQTHSATMQFTVTVTAEKTAEPATPTGLLVAKREVVFDD